MLAWHERPGALQRLTPPWWRARVVERAEPIAGGRRMVLEARFGPLTRRLVIARRVDEAARQLTDEQVQGPFARFVNTRRFEPASPDSSMLEERVEYALPGGALGRLAAGRAFDASLYRTLAYRHALLRLDLERHRAEGPGRPLHIAVTGSSGLVGMALCAFLEAGGHRVRRLVRRPPLAPEEIPWDPSAPGGAPAALDGIDAVVHLAGENIAGGRWTAARKARIRSSRVDGTRVLSEALARLERPPAVLLNASAVGYYGNRGDALLDETSSAGADFLAGVCQEWEAATAAVRARGVRVALMRFGIVLSPAGGALAKLLPPFRLGAGGPVGSGRQFMSWISLEDAIGALHFALSRPALDGAVNVVAPAPVTNAAFARTLGRVLRRPALLPLPAPLVRRLFGEMGEAVLLAGQRVRPRRLEEAGFRFCLPALDEALRFELGRG